jgi:succinoglycan biosynthesis protein ExoA
LIAAQPTVSVAVPVLSEAQHIQECLRSITAQTYSGVVEILVVDGGSSDETCVLASAFPQVRVLDNPARIQSAALNVALAEAHGEVMVRVDGYCRFGARL